MENSTSRFLRSTNPEIRTTALSNGSHRKDVAMFVKQERWKVLQATCCERKISHLTNELLPRRDWHIGATDFIPKGIGEYSLSTSYVYAINGYPVRLNPDIRISAILPTSEISVKLNYFRIEWIGIGKQRKYERPLWIGGPIDHYNEIQSRKLSWQ